MNAFKNILFLSSILVIIANSGCKKNSYVEPDPVLPPVTQVGANTFGFMYGDALWVFNSEKPKNKIDAYITVQGKYFQMRVECAGASYDPRLDVITIFADNFNGVGKYSIETILGAELIFVQSIDPNKDLIYNIQPGSELVITKYDPDKKIVAGEFSFSAKKKGGDEIITVTKGRFDVIYRGD